MKLKKNKIMKKWGKKPIQLELNRPLTIWDRDKKK